MDTGASECEILADVFYATAAPPSLWSGAADQAKAKESSTPVEESESEKEGLDEVDDENDEEHEDEPEPEPEPVTPVDKKPAEVVAPKESERQLSKKELKKKELAELEAVLAEFGLNKPEGHDSSHVILGGAQDTKVETSNGESDKKESNAPGKSKSAKKKDKSSKIAKEQQDQPNGMFSGNGTDKTIETEKAEEATVVDVKEKLKKVASAKKKK